jgi:hypothetical protein
MNGEYVDDVGSRVAEFFLSFFLKVTDDKNI